MLKLFYKRHLLCTAKRIDFLKPNYCKGRNDSNKNKNDKFKDCKSNGVKLTVKRVENKNKKDSVATATKDTTKKGDSKRQEANIAAFEVPDFINPICFRELKSAGEQLGPNASKDAVYKNAEFYAYHKLSFYDLAIETLVQRCNAPNDEKDEKNHGNNEKAK